MDDMTHVAILLVKATPELPIVGTASGRAKVLGYDPQALHGTPLPLLCPSLQPDGRSSGDTLVGVFGQLQHAGSLSLPWTFQTRDGEARPHELHLTLTERDGEPQVAVCMVDVSRMQSAELLNQAKNELLEMVATGHPLQPVLDRLTALIESQFEGLYCSVLLLDLDGRAAALSPSTGIGVIAFLTLSLAVPTVAGMFVHRRRAVVTRAASQPMGRRQSNVRK